MRRIAGPMGFAFAAAVAAVTADLAAALGGRPGPYPGSPQFRDGAFRNPEPLRWVPPGSVREAVGDMVRGRRKRRPSGPVPQCQTPDAAPGDGLHVTWFGHASTLVELAGTRVLIDPMWSDRASPSRVIGPRRLFAPPQALTDLPDPDVVLVSHDHYDHLDMRTVRHLAHRSAAAFVVPLGVGTHLRRWGVAPERITELDWHDETRLAGLRITATPGRHFSGRAFARNNTLWASWVLAGQRHRVFYSGDTGYFDGFARIGADHGPFDVTLMQLGAYAPSWPDVHMTPEEAVAAHVDVGGGLLVPVHWGTFDLGPHGWADPVDRARKEAAARGVALTVPKPGERVDVASPPELDPWWESLA
ncbi:L-ascorbate metabolism protein UlaG (beta-lactamase superfamily) [Prauserella sediminis]|uniref:L-ascorbate metabolism protein UlaG (Beta-lactamase superfamily) n=1 Tax=Prauserella sediminis TaxID=577680 RepID=A0A839XZG1_9PSEU|nr:MBL fold metallo-hydrolase [Prauserella sediminis]MBB3665105.1 L-ascorbate metabolism protein UlaG (beta-lactamase superfamily) [Prauserella sediminis]